jgi:hypothetical protein
VAGGAAAILVGPENRGVLFFETSIMVYQLTDEISWRTWIFKSQLH